MTIWKKTGVIQGFWSINPKPLSNEETLKSTAENGFIRFDNEIEMQNSIKKLIDMDLNFFSGMRETKELGNLIEIANSKKTYEEKGFEFLRLLKEWLYGKK